MTILERKDHFIKRATEFHKNKFDYSLIEYQDAKTRVKIICPIHGIFEQKPDKHLCKGSKGCQQCWWDIKKQIEKERDYSKIKQKESYSKEKFTQIATEKFGDKFKYNLINYTGITGNKIEIICPIHGSFINSPRNHLLSGTGCPHCGLIRAKKSRVKNYQYAIEQFNIKHNFYYDYPESNEKIYFNKKSKIDIICKKHGVFQKTGRKHLLGQGCFHCKIEELIDKNILVGGYSEELFIKKPELKDFPAILYYLKINNGKYYKIGISRTELKYRTKGIISKAKRFNEKIVIETVKVWDKNLYDCFREEQEILNKYKKDRVYRRWSTELFDRDILFN